MHFLRNFLFIVSVLYISHCLMLSRTAQAELPPIRLSATNQVPACVTPDRLMGFLKMRNERLLSRFQNIADWYKYHGEVWQVRWDYAFYQMAIETNFLTFRRSNGRRGDVHPRQNNFAGIGTTGGGVPGNEFPDVKTGVLAQIQHLVVYSGERLDDPVAPRTRLTQDLILRASRPVASRRPVTFQDLSGRWAVDRRYGRSIEHIASLYREKFCNGQQDNRAQGEQPRSIALAPDQAVNTTKYNASYLASAAAPLLPSSARECRVQVASYGGPKTLLIQSQAADTVQLTTLDVYPGFEAQMAKNFSDEHAPGGQTVASFDTRAAALNKAHTLCKRLTSVQ